jgi:hypothetical protein
VVVASTSEFRLGLAEKILRHRKLPLEPSPQGSGKPRVGLSLRTGQQPVLSYLPPKQHFNHLLLVAQDINLVGGALDELRGNFHIADEGVQVFNAGGALRMIERSLIKRTPTIRRGAL